MKIMIVSSEKTMLKNLKYGTIITDVPDHPNSVYMKVDKHSNNPGLEFPPKHSTLFNLRTGTLRIVHTRTQVTVLELADEALHLKKATDISKHMRD